MKQTIILLLLWQFCTVLSVYALPFKELSTTAGLSNRRVLASIKDGDGYIWFATRMGIDRYNGESFTNYKLADSPDIPEEHPKGIFINGQNEIYAFSEHNIYKYSYDKDRFSKQNTSGIPRRETINTVTADPSGHFWIGTNAHLYRLMKSDSIVRPVKQNVSVYCILFQNNQYGWFGSSKGVFHLLGQEDESYLPQKDKNLAVLNTKRIQSLYHDTLTNYLWIGTFDNGIYIYDKNQRKLKTVGNTPGRSLPTRSITCIGTDRIWAGIDGSGIREYNRFNGKFKTEYSQNAAGYNHIKVNNIYHILDNGNSVWICTYTSGVFVHNKSRMINTFYTHAENKPQSLINNHVNCILEDRQNRLWLGTNSGISRYDRNTNIWKHFLQDSSNGNAIVLSLFQDSENNVWAGGYACGVVRIDTNDQIHPLQTLPSGPAMPKYVYAISQDNDGDIWLGGIINNLTRYKPSDQSIKQYPVKDINQIRPYGKDTLLLATSKGVLFLNKTNEKISQPTPPEKGIITKANTLSICVLPSTPTQLWLGTEGQGVLCYDLNACKWKQYTQANGLSSNSVCGIQHDTQGRLWIGTENGLNCLLPKHNCIDVFYEPDGLPSNTFNLRSYALLHNGNIAWGTPEGAFELIPDEFNRKTGENYNLRFEEFALFNRPAHPSDVETPLHTTIDRSSHITLDHNQHSFSFRFLNLGYLNAAKNMYSWYLEGFDKEWSLPTDHHHAVYTNIPPGKYTFRVKVFNGSDDKNFQERAIHMTIRSPWWNTRIAWTAYVIAAILIMYYLVRAYKDRLEARDSDQKIRFFINIAHDIRTPLTLIKAPLNEIEEEPLTENGHSALALAQRNTEKLLNMVTQLLDFQKIEREAMSLQVEETEINSFVGNAVSNFEPLAREKQISLHLQLTPEESNKVYIDRRKLSIIIDNLLSNSIKYTCQHGNVWIKSSVASGRLTIEITDDGIGISPQAQKKLFNRFYRAENATNSKETGSGIGLLLTKKMTLLHKGSINFSSNVGAGTTFRIELPVQKNDYAETEIIKKEFEQHPKPHTEQTAEETNKLKLLVVEDNEELRGYLAHCLNRDYRIIESADGQAALDIIHKENPDFIISDVMMPVLSGIELCSRLKSNIETCHIPIILLTSLAEREDIIKGLNAGADDYITKPFDLSVLKTKIAAIINNRRLYRKKYIDKSAFSDETSVINELDRKFMSKLVEYIEEKMMNENFSIDTLAMEMAMSRSVFFKKIKSLTGQNPQEFIRDIKMKKAATLLNEKKYSIGEIAYLTGYPNAKYFSTAFKKYYGTTPSTFIAGDQPADPL